TIRGLQGLEPNLNFPVIPGIEITLDKGHFNVFGIGESHQWVEDIGISTEEVPLPPRYTTVNQLLERTAQAGLLNSINHPLLHPWSWRYPGTDLSFIHCVELWNDLYWPGNVYANPKTVNLWTKWLNAGYQVTAIGGSDYHYLPKPDQQLYGERLNQPTTHVYAEQLSAPAILEGLRRRRVYVSKGPKLEFQAQVDGNIYYLGDDLGKQTGNLEIGIVINDGPERIIAQVVKNGEIISNEQIMVPDTTIEFSYQVESAEPAWYRVEVLDLNWELLTITNPIFLNFQDSDERSSPGSILW
ncbi:MAG: CehA/McbA family metallohydrolase, partial [Anaerolineales bacterium]|nr:CehA/McbA family metallohydrolase [Anaerolineales bacterium]